MYSAQSPESLLPKIIIHITVSKVFLPTHLIVLHVLVDRGGAEMKSIQQLRTIQLSVIAYFSIWHTPDALHVELHSKQLLKLRI